MNYYMIQLYNWLHMCIIPSYMFDVKAVKFATKQINNCYCPTQFIGAFTEPAISVSCAHVAIRWPTEIFFYYFTTYIKHLINFPFSVINLKVKNIYEDTHLPETLMYVGYSNIYKQCNEVWHCHIPGDVNDNAISINNVSKNNSANDTKETKALDFLNCTNEEKCEPTSYITVKVVSKNLEKYKELITLLEVLDENSNPMEKDYWSQHVTANLYKNSVVICADNYISHDGSDILAYKVVKDCNLSDFNNSNILGIIAPKPIDLMSRLPVPCIFYDVPKILPEYEYEYPNSAIVHENYDKHLTKAAVKLIELSKWIRVGILSDISAYSLDF